MHWTSECADCGQTLRVPARPGNPILCPRCGRAVSARPPREKPAAPAGHVRRRRYWPWVVGGVIGLALASACVVALLPPAHRHRPGGVSPIASIPISPNSPVDANAGARLMPKEGIRVPRPIIPPVEIGDVSDGSLRDLCKRAPALKPAGQLESLLVMAGGAGGGPFFTADADGTLRCYSASLELLGQTRLQRVPYLMAVDGQRRQLYAAVTSFPWLRQSALGDRDQALGDLCVYDVSSLLEGKSPPEELKPSQTVELDAQLTGLQLSEDGAWLCYLAESLSGAHLGRIATETMATKKRPVPANGLSGMADVGNGRFVALAGGLLFHIDVANWTVNRSTVITNGTLLGVYPAGVGKVFLLERRLGTYVVLLDLEANKVVSRHLSPMVGRYYLCSQPGRLYLGTSAVFDGQIQAFEVKGGSMTALGVARRDDERLIRGGLYLTPDGRYLVTGNGHVYHAPPVER